MAMTPFQQVLDAHRDVVWRVCVAGAGREDAEDAFQETWLSALRAYARLDERANVRAWLITIAQRKAIDVHRARRRRPIPVGDELPERPAPVAPAGDDELWAKVRELPPGPRAAITLRYAGDLRATEVAQILDISDEAVRRRIADGLKHLRLEVQPT
jgi:RNA polymerase sigma factor (sigma-70 family)